jgi:hypothetical protein
MIKTKTRRLANPLNWHRFVKNIRKSLKGHSSPVDPASILPGEWVTRYEEVEVDDVTPDPTEEWCEQKEKKE